MKKKHLFWNIIGLIVLIMIVYLLITFLIEAFNGSCIANNFIFYPINHIIGVCL